MIASTPFEQVKAFIAKFTGVQPARISMDTKLEISLGITGEDGEVFMWAFFNEFGIDYTEFEITKHFAQEGFDPTGITLIIRKLFTKLPPLTAPTYDISVADLVRSVNERRWVNPII